MLSYPYLLAVYRAILSQSAAIQGRVYMAPFWASELNSDNLNQLVADTLAGPMPKQYPLSLILPPLSNNDAPYSSTSGSWDYYTINQLFLKQEGRTSDGQIEDANDLINNSQHTIMQDWHDMRRVGISFMRTFREGLIATNLGQSIRMSDRTPIRIVPVTRLSNDKLSGVLLSYQVSIFDSCGDIEDYPADPYDAIVLPAGDQHPEHSL